MLLLNRRLFKWNTIYLNLSKNTGVACFGDTLTWACSVWTDLRYCLTDKCEAGLPKPKRSSQSPERPKALKIERNFPIRESAVPADNRIRQLQVCFPCKPRNWHESKNTIVLPFPSFHTRKRTISFGVAENKVYCGWSKPEKRKDRSLVAFFGVGKP